MDEQPQYTSSDNNLLSRDKIIAILESPLSNGEMLSQESTQTSILDLIRTDQQWWTTCGRAALESIRQLVESNPGIELANAISSLMLKVAAKLHEALQCNERVPSLIWAEVLTVGLPASSEVNVWINLFNVLSQAIHVYKDETDSWVLRSLLLQAWGRMPSLQDSPLMDSWLEVRWNELGKLLALNLPDRWYIRAIISLLNVPLDIPARHVIESIIDAEKVVEEALLQLIKTQTATSRKTAIRFFATLAENGYPRKVQLLGEMLTAVANEQAYMELLLNLARLDPTAKELATFLEHHCQVVLSEYPLPPTLVEFIRQYLADFNTDDLYLRPARELLQRLQHRNKMPELQLPADLKAYIQGWYNIAEFIEQPVISKFWLRNVSAMTQLRSNQRIQLIALLIPRLVKLISTEVDLCRVLDNLAPVLIESGITSIDSGLLLLEHIASPAAKMYEQEPLLMRLIPYIKVMLGDAHYLASPEKEKYIYSWLHSLLAYIDGETLAMLTAHIALWPLDIQTEWRAYQTYRGLLPRVDTSASTTHTTSVSLLPAEETQQRIVAIVNRQEIPYERFHKIYRIKAAYKQYNHHIINMKDELILDHQLLKQETLNDLVDSVLIKEYIHHLIKDDSSLSGLLDPVRQLPATLQGFKDFCGSKYAEFNDRDVDSALHLFIQRELFDCHLEKQRESLDDWLKQQKQKAKIILDVHYLE